MKIRNTLAALVFTGYLGACIPIPEGDRPIGYKVSITEEQAQQCINESNGSEKARLNGEADSLGTYCVSFMYGFLSKLERCFEVIHPELSYGCSFARKGDDRILTPAQAAQICVDANQNRTEVSELENLTLDCASTSRDYVFSSSD